MDNLVKRIFNANYKVLKTVKGRELVGLKYTSAFDDLPSNRKISNEKLFHSVVATDSFIMPISEDEGTGLVHTSTGTGAEDHKLGKKIGLPVMPAIEDNADYLKDYGYLAGKNAKKNPELVINVLEKKDEGKYFFKQELYKHRYPVCWRCKNELVFKLTDEWYIAIDPVRKDMISISKKIKWIPSFGLKREIDWLTNMHDWLISKKNRYWGLALPIWECKCGNFEVIGGYDELKERAVEGWKEFDGHTPHKPYIDKVKIKCGKCGEIMERIPDVGNPWLDAGIVPFSTISEDNKSEPLYLKDKNEFYKWFPADFITESFPGQFKNWFYSVLAMSTILENMEPYKTVLGFATLLAEDGRPMHKSWGNSIEFNEGAEKIGADVMRWMYLSANPSDDLIFGFHSADDVRRRFYLKLWNIYNFFVTYANTDFYQAPISDINSDKLSILDRWILARLSETIKNVEKQLDAYRSSFACAAIEEFTNDFSNWYIRRSRGRVGNLSGNDKDRDDFYHTTYFTLLNLSKLLSPLLPFMSELIYRNLTKKVSVHLEDWPRIDNFENNELNKGMNIIRKASEAIHAERKSKNISLKQPLLDVLVKSPDKKPDDELLFLLLEEVNVRRADWETGGDVYKVKLNTEITPELLEEAKTRELIRKIQNERKNLGVKLTDEIKVRSEWLPQKNELLELIKKKTLARSIEKNEKFEVSS